MIITINVPVVFMARYVMVLRSATAVALLKTIKHKRHKNNWYIVSFMYPSAVVYCCCVLLSVVGCSCVLLCVVEC